MRIAEATNPERRSKRMTTGMFIIFETYKTADTITSISNTERDMGLNQPLLITFVVIFIVF